MEDAGRVSFHSGASGARLSSLEGAAESARLGEALALAGDWDHDGREDLMAGGRGMPEVLLLSGEDGSRLASIPAPAGAKGFGAALAAGRYDLHHQALVVGAPETSAPYPSGGEVRVYLRKAGQPNQAVAVAAAASGTPPPATEPAILPDFLGGELPSQFTRVEAEDGRWVFYSTMEADQTRDAIKLIERAYDRLDEVLGGEAIGPAAATPAPVVLAFVSSLSDQRRISREIGRQFEHLEAWTKEWGGLPQMILWNPLVSVIRHDDTTALVRRPEIQVLHHAVHLELVRRYGALPGWIPESISYGIQDEIAGEIYAYSNRGWEQLADDYHRVWREHASDLWAGDRPPRLQTLFGGRHDSFRQQQAYGRFGLGLWLLGDPQRRLAELCRQLAAARPAGTLPETDYQPPEDRQAELFAQVYGRDYGRDAATFWGKVSLAGGPRARREAAAASVEHAIERLELEILASRNGQLRFASDLSKKSTGKILKRTEAILGRLEKALGTGLPKDRELTVFVLRDRDSFRALCDGIAEAAPGLGAYLGQARESTGFLLPDMPVAAYWDDIKFQEQTRPDQSVAHNVVHLWLRQIYGQLPLWLSEGLACACEEAEFREVWAMWNLEGFVYDASRAAWRSTAREYVTTEEDTIRCYDWSGVAYGSVPPQVVRPKPALHQLYEYPATSYQDDLAHMAFAFAVYGLEGDSKGFRKFLAALQEEYEENWSTVGRFEPDAKLVEKLVRKSFGRNFEKDFVSWWVKKGGK